MTMVPRLTRPREKRVVLGLGPEPRTRWRPVRGTPGDSRILFDRFPGPLSFPGRIKFPRGW